MTNQIPTPAKRIFIDSVGCTENILDGAILKDIAGKNGYVFTQNARDADLIVFNTCAFKQKQEEMCLRILGKYQRIKKPEAEVIVCGCLVGINEERLGEVFSGVSFGPGDLKNFYDYLDKPKPERIEEAYQITREISDAEMFGQRAIVEKIYSLKRFFKQKLRLNLLPNFNFFDYIGDDKTLFVRISRGCLNTCGYCAIRFAQGRLVSQPPETIVSIIKQGIADGFEKILLVGTNTSHYGRDIGTSIFRLLEELLALEGDFELIVHNFEPFGVQEDPEKFLELFSSPRILSFYFPINSGSQEVLDKMKRGYRIDKVMEVIKKLQRINQKILIRSEFIVGYPGERWKDFMRTVSLIRKSGFDYVDLHYFSPRPNTHAARLENHVPAVQKHFRFLLINIYVFFKVTIRKLRPI